MYGGPRGVVAFICEQIIDGLRIDGLRKADSLRNSQEVSLISISFLEAARESRESRERRES